MSEVASKKNNVSVFGFLNAIENKTRRADAKALHKLMREVSGERARMCGSSIVGFGSYEYRYASGHSGSSILCGFSPRKQNLVVYIMPGFKPYKSLLTKLGKFKTGKSCLYINKLADVDQKVLRALLDRSVRDMRKKYHK